MADHRDNPIQATLAGFIDYAKSLNGDEKGEAQVFCDRLFKAFGHAVADRPGTYQGNLGKHHVRTGQETLDKAVREAFGMKPKDDILEFLLKLNLEHAEKECRGELIQGSGLPATYPDAAKLVSDDCIRVDINLKKSGPGHLHIMRKVPLPENCTNVWGVM
jgi:hypothetical protein